MHQHLDPVYGEQARGEHESGLLPVPVGIGRPVEVGDRPDWRPSGRPGGINENVFVGTGLPDGTLNRLAFGRNLLSRWLILVFLAFGAGAAGADLDDGLGAYKRGDYAAARQVWAPLAETGDREAQYFLGHLYAKGQGVVQDHAEALYWFRAAAVQGDTYGQFALGYMYENGAGVARDDGEAARWYRVAAEQGNALAQNNLGLMYEAGRGVPRDYVMAHLWFARAAVDADAGLDRDKAARNLDQVEAKMTPAQVEAAKRLVRERAQQ